MEWKEEVNIGSYGGTKGYEWKGGEETHKAPSNIPSAICFVNTCTAVNSADMEVGEPKIYLQSSTEINQSKALTSAPTCSDIFRPMDPYWSYIGLFVSSFRMVYALLTSLNCRG